MTMGLVEIEKRFRRKTHLKISTFDERASQLQLRVQRLKD